MSEHAKWLVTPEEDPWVGLARWYADLGGALYDDEPEAQQDAETLTRLATDGREYHVFRVSVGGPDGDYWHLEVVARVLPLRGTHPPAAADPTTGWLQLEDLRSEARALCSQVRGHYEPEEPVYHVQLERVEALLRKLDDYYSADEEE